MSAIASGCAGPVLQCPRCAQGLTLPTMSAATTCSGCGTVYSAPDGIPELLPLQAQIDRAWHEVFLRAMTSAAGEGRRVCYRFEWQHALMIGAVRGLLADLPAGAMLLDVGCGHGKLGSAFTGCCVVGVDFVRAGLPAAKARGLEAFNADANALPFADAQFDAVIAIELFQNIDDYRPVMAQLARVCRPGGRVVVSTLHRRSLLRRFARTIREVQALFGLRAEDRKTHRAHQRTPEEIEASARSLPLALRHVVWSHFPLPLLHTTAGSRYWARTLASNFILEFHRH
jgi:SAM-dependent methyltransferase